ncbi:MAG: replication/maintenance protein RepL, partial [Sagittula sp.]|uniref:replication/maintenance protein RepL n=1 Tax=Sagittula sp. TaxID=2038081 RepID=UPI0040599E2F
MWPPREQVRTADQMIPDLLRHGQAILILQCRQECFASLTRGAMADYLGLTLETVSRQISALKRDNVIALEGKRH